VVTARKSLILNGLFLKNRFQKVYLAVFEKATVLTPWFFFLIPTFITTGWKDPLRQESLCVKGLCLLGISCFCGFGGLDRVWGEALGLRSLVVGWALAGPEALRSELKCGQPLWREVRPFEGCGIVWGWKL
jgi:hypothetical protein